MDNNIPTQDLQNKHGRLVKLYKTAMVSFAVFVAIAIAALAYTTYQAYIAYTADQDFSPWLLPMFVSFGLLFQVLFLNHKYYRYLKVEHANYLSGKHD